MKTRQSKQKAGFLVAALLVCTAQSALAQTLFATGVLYEIREDINCNPGGAVDPTDPGCFLANTTEGFGTRIADAILAGGGPHPSPVVPGTLLPGGALGPAAELTGPATLTASSILSRVDWTGPIQGKFTALRADGMGVTTGVISGQFDLSQAAITGTAPVYGHWRGTKGTLSAGGSFDGFFLLPFPCPPPVPGACYVSGPLALAEYVVDPGTGALIPLIKLQVNLYTK